MDRSAAELWRLRDLLDQQRLEKPLPGRVRLHGHPVERLPNNLDIRIEGTIGEELPAALTQIAAPTASACHDGQQHRFNALVAMGMREYDARSAVRFTLGRRIPEGVRTGAGLLATQALEFT